MAETEEKLRDDEFLKGRQNYYAWLKNFNDYCFIESYLVIDSSDTLNVTKTYSTTTAAVKAMKKWLHKRVGGSGLARQCFNVEKTIPEIIAAFNAEFGSGYADPDTLIEGIKEDIFFDSRSDPQLVFVWLDENLRAVNSALSSVENPNVVLADEEYLLIILKGLENVARKTDFWKDVYGTIRQQKREKKAQTPAYLRQLLINHWHDHSTPETILKHTCGSTLTKLVRPPYAGGASDGNTQNLNNSQRNKKKYVNCSNKENGRIKVQGSHGTEKCYYGDKPGWDKVDGSQNSAHSASNDGNKPSEEYFYDTGATPTSFVKDKPINFHPRIGSVQTANGISAKTLGHGTLKFGEILVQATYAPTFSKNLISGIDIMKSGAKTIIADGKLIITDTVVIPDSSKILATGKLDPSVGLLKMDSIIDETLRNNFKVLPTFTGLSFELAHKRLGHVGEAMVKRTAANDSIVIKYESSKCICKYCMKGKMRKKNIPKTSRSRELGEVIAADEQGPFRIEGVDGTKYNVKFMEKTSSYLKQFNLKDIRSITLLEQFKPWLARLENRIGKKVKYFQCDQSFDGVFLDFLEECGITKLKGEEYNYHFPGMVENANYNVTRHARAMLMESKLPPKYYSEAQLCAVYLHNCMVHSGKTISPREMCGQRKKSISELVPFGCHGFAFLKKEWRNHPLKLGKLEPVAVACRMIGYADDDETEEMKGYKVLITEDWEGKPLSEPYIIYTNEVKFDEFQPMETLYLESPLADDDDLFGLADDSEYIDEPELMHSDSSDSSQIDSGSEDSFVGLSNEELFKMENTVKEYYGDWFNSANCCGISPLEVVYAMLALTEGIQTPLTTEQALGGPENKEWKAAMDSEEAKLQKFKTFDLVEMPEKKINIVKCKWVFRKKLNLDRSVKEYKARLVAKGFSQRYGIDFFETFAPVAKMKSIRAITAIAAAKGFLIYQDDAPSAFLNPDLKEIVYMQQIPGYEDGTTRVCLLKKTIYGLKQSPREWNEVVDRFMKQQGFIQLQSDTCIYTKGESDNQLIVAVYVDDILTCGKKDSKQLHEFREALHKRFNMDSGGIIKQYLGMNFSFLSNGSITIDQQFYLLNKLTEFEKYIGEGSRSSPLPSDYLKQLEGMKNEPIIPNTQFPYREMVGSLMYAMVSTMPSLAQPLSVVSKYLSKPSLTVCNFVRHIFQYVRGNVKGNGITYGVNPRNLQIQGFVDAAYGNNMDYKSTTGFCFTLNGSIISWNSKCQPVTAFSAAESEYIAASEAAKEAIWWRSFMDELGLPQTTTILHEDNQACILLSKNPQSHHRTKHIQIRFHFIREKVLSKEISLMYLPTKFQLADIFTKGCSGSRLRPILNSLGCGIKESGEN